MAQILHWGYEAPVRNDYIKDKRQLMYKIRKADKEYISEKNDNFRKPLRDNDHYLFNFMGLEHQEQFKRKLYELAVEGESEKFKHTTYKSLFCNDEKEWWDQVFKMVTPAGKPSYKPVPSIVVTPMEFIKQRIEAKIQEIIEKDFNGAMAEHFMKQEAVQQQNIDNLSGQLQSDREAISNKQANRVEPIDHDDKKISSKNLKAVETAEAIRAMKNKRRAQTAQQRKNIEARIAEMKIVSRWLPDSALTTYFGKPAFHPYGNGNTQPTVGGTIYGNYLKTHNVNPHSGDNIPEFKQVFERAILGCVVHEQDKSKSKSPSKKQG